MITNEPYVQVIDDADRILWIPASQLEHWDKDGQDMPTLPDYVIIWDPDMQFHPVVPIC